MNHPCMIEDRMRYLGICWVLELLEHVGIGSLLHDFFSLLHSALHSLRGVREDELSTEGPQQDTSLQTHGCRHGEDELVTLGSGNESQTNTRVSTGWLHKDTLFSQMGSELLRNQSGQGWRIQGKQTRYKKYTIKSVISHMK